MKNSFCILPFIHVATDSSGEARYCCKSDLVKDGQGRAIQLGHDSLQRLWNGPEMQKMRRQMLNEEKPVACEACWREDDLGRLSKRRIENYKYLETHRERLTEAKENQGKLLSAPTYFDLRLGRLCNLKCRICGPHFSSKWAAEVPQLSQDPILSSLYATSQEKMDWYADPKFREDFLKVLPGLEEIYVTGGEPTIIPELFDLLKACVDSGHSEHICLRINSNLVSLPEEFLGLLGNFGSVFFAPSLDGVGARNDWMRSPSRWSEIVKNFDRIFSLREKTELSIEINCTVSLINILFLEELVEFVDAKSKEFDFPVQIQFTPLFDPSFLRLSNLPQDLRSQVLEQFQRIEKNYPKVLRSEFDLPVITQLLEGNPPNQKERKIFAHHTRTLDKIRKENFADVFPELKILLVDNV